MVTQNLPPRSHLSNPLVFFPNLIREIHKQVKKKRNQNIKLFIMDSTSGAIISPLFCAPYPIDLAFTTKPPGHKKSSNLSTVDAAGKILFSAKKSSWGGFTQLRDSAGQTILTMKAKFRTLHDRWQAFTGDSTEAKDLVFSIKRSSALQIHDGWFVYLAANTKENNCDFKIVGSYIKKNYTIYKGDTSFVVAQLIRSIN